MFLIVDKRLKMLHIHDMQVKAGGVGSTSGFVFLHYFMLLAYVLV